MDATELAQDAKARWGTWRAAAEATGVDHATLWRMAHGVGEPEAINVRRLEVALKGETMTNEADWVFLKQQYKERLASRDIAGVGLMGWEAALEANKALEAEVARLTGELAESRRDADEYTRECNRLCALVPPAAVVEFMRHSVVRQMNHVTLNQRTYQAFLDWLERQPKGER